MVQHRTVPHSCSTTTWASILFCVRKKETTRFHSYDPTSVPVKQIIVFFQPPCVDSALDHSTTTRELCPESSPVSGHGGGGQKGARVPAPSTAKRTATFHMQDPRLRLGERQIEAVSRDKHLHLRLNPFPPLPTFGKTPVIGTLPEEEVIWHKVPSQRNSSHQASPLNFGLG